MLIKDSYREIRRRLRPVKRLPNAMLAGRQLRKLMKCDERIASVASLVQRLRTTSVSEIQAGVPAIELERRKLAACDRRLDDGRFDHAGPHDYDRTIQQSVEASSSSTELYFLHELIRATRPREVLELGTNLGISAAYLAHALRSNGDGHVTTLDASPYRIAVAQEVHKSLALDNVCYRVGMFSDTLASELERLGSIDYAFIDGHHQYQPTIDYFNQILPYASDSSIFVFDDVRKSAGMLRAWREVSEHPNVEAALDLRLIGVCVTRKAPVTVKHLFKSPPGFFPAFDAIADFT